MSINQTLIVFTRYPEAGKTKTRLIPVLGETGAANFQRYMTEETIKKIKKLQTNIPLNVEIHFSGGDEQLMRKWLGENLIFKPQIEGNLGEKMLSALTSVLSKKEQKAVIIGTDCLDLTESILQKAFKSCADYDLVIGEASDGGYYLIGLNKVIPDLFKNIKWGSSQVFQTTIKKANKLELKVHKLPVLNDIDRPQDLAKLQQNYFGSRTPASSFLKKQQNHKNLKF